MNKKGFTLVEVLAVIILLSAIISITVPIVTNVINTSRDSVYKSQINKILSATYDYSLKNSSILPKYNVFCPGKCEQYVPGTDPSLPESTALGHGGRKIPPPMPQVVPQPLFPSP